MVDFVINDINGNNTIVNNGPIVINGDFPDTSGIAVSIAQYPLQVDSASATSITCSPVNVLASSLPFGSHSMKVTGAGSATKTILLEIDADHQVVTLDRVVPPLLAEGLDGVAEGDQLACPKVVGASTLTLTNRGDVTYSPPVPDGTTHNRYWCDVSYGAWASGPVTINGGTPAGPVSWTGIPTPPQATAGSPYTYNIGTVVEGDRPITLTDAGEPLPPGLSYDVATFPETIRGTPTTPGTYQGIVTRAYNGSDADSEPYTIIVGDVPAEWNGTPAPSPAAVGTSYVYSIGLKLDGARPVTLSNIGAPLPPGLFYSTTSSPEVIIGTPTTYGVYSGIITRADNGTIADSAPYTITVNATPELSGLVISGITDNGATFTVNALVGAGAVYYVADVSTQRPSPEQIAAGVTAEGAPAMAAGGYTVTQAGPQPAVSFVGFERFTTVSLWVVQTLSGAPASNILGQVFVTTGATNTLVSFYNRPGGPGNKFGG